jgi:predicted acylesterase/phospholipase RssA
VADAIQASMSLPGVFPAYVTDQRLLVDGGVLNNLPIDIMASDGGDRIIAVDVMSRGGRDSVFDSHSGYHKRGPTTLETSQGLRLSAAGGGRQDTALSRTSS